MADEALPPIERIWPDQRPALSLQEIIEAYGMPGRLAAPEQQPWIRMNFVSTLDGSATGPDGRSGTISNPADRVVFDALRRLCDAVLVAAGTVRLEGYSAMRVDQEAAAWRESYDLTEHPLFVIASRSLDLDPESAVFQDAPLRPLVATVTSAPPEKRVALEVVADVVNCGTDVLDPALLRQELLRRGIRDVLSEGGPTFFGSLLEADAVDELCLTLSADLTAGSGPRIAHGVQVKRELALRHVLRSGDDLFLRYTRS